MTNNTKPIEYKLSKRMFNALLNTRKGDDSTTHPYDYVMKVINEQFGLRGTVKQLHIIED